MKKEEEKQAPFEPNNLGGNLKLPPKLNPPKLAEGEDFYWEKGLMVFTAAYHLKRGYCCGSGCRHCPFRQVAFGER